MHVPLHYKLPSLSYRNTQCKESNFGSVVLEAQWQVLDDSNGMLLSTEVVGRRLARKNTINVYIIFHSESGIYQMLKKKVYLHKCFTPC